LNRRRIAGGPRPTQYALFARPATGRGSLYAARRAEKNLDRHSPPRQSRPRVPLQQPRRRESRLLRILGLWRSQAQTPRQVPAGRSVARSAHHRTLGHFDRREKFCGVCRRPQAIPANDHRAGPLVCIECDPAWKSDPLRRGSASKLTPQFSIFSTACFGMKRAVGDAGCGDDRSDTT
jgi:hypothetical protein